MTMQTLRDTTDAREIDLAEIKVMRNCIAEFGEIARLLCAAIAQNESAKCVASSLATAILAVDNFAATRSEQHDSTITNDNTLDAWGWSDETPEGEMNWRCTIRIIEESDL